MEIPDLVWSLALVLLSTSAASENYQSCRRISNKAETLSEEFIDRSTNVNTIDDEVVDKIIKQSIQDFQLSHENIDNNEKSVYARSNKQ